MLRAEGLHGVERVHTVLTRQEVGDGAAAVGKPAEDGGAVRHAFITRHGKFSAERGDGVDFEGHGRSAG